jgi:hypothetical protein
VNPSYDFIKACSFLTVLCLLDEHKLISAMPAHKTGRLTSFTTGFPNNWLVAVTRDFREGVLLGKFDWNNDDFCAIRLPGTGLWSGGKR